VQEGSWIHALDKGKVSSQHRHEGSTGIKGYFFHSFTASFNWYGRSAKKQDVPIQPERLEKESQ
jgi:hypothetical protein